MNMRQSGWRDAPGRRAKRHQQLRVGVLQPLTIARRQSSQCGRRVGLERDVERRRRAGQQRRQRAVGGQRRQVLLRIAQHGAIRVLDAEPDVLQVQRAIDFRRHQRRQLRQVARVSATRGQRQQDAPRKQNTSECMASRVSMK